MSESAAPPPPGSKPTPSADLRERITRDAYRLAPELLGTPLARPWRRGSAMALDGLFIGILSSASGMLFGLAAAVVLFRVSGRPAPGGYIRKSVRLVLRFWAAVILFVVVLRGWGGITDRFEEDDPDPEAAAAVDEGGDLLMDGTGGLRTGAELARIATAESEAVARQRAASLVTALRQAGMAEEEIMEMFEGLAELPGKPWMGAVSDSVITALGRTAPDTFAREPDTAVLAYARALVEGDSAAAAERRPAAAVALAADTVAELGEEIRERERRRAALAARVDRLEDELEEGPGIMGVLRGLADDLGLGLGWAGLYFTTFVTLWKGRTPGKRIMGIRIIRLDGQQIGWWAAFERFGGYAAGVATGLLGFAQIFWDRNRQGVQDKISETVVIRDAPRAG